MNKCTKCGTEFEGKFCPECGTAVSGKPVCPRCGSEVNEGAKFCPNCGCSLTAPQQEVQAAPSAPAVVVINFNWRKYLKLLSPIFFFLWAALLWAFYASKVVEGDGFLVESVDLYKLLEQEMYFEMYAATKALIAFAAIADAYAILLLVLQLKGSRLVGSIASYASFAFHLAVIICAGVLSSKCKQFFEGFDDYNGNFAAVVISLTVVFALLQAAALVLDGLFGERKAEPKAAKPKRERKPIATPKFIVNTGKWLRAHKALAAILSVTFVAAVVLCTVLPVTLGNIFRIGKVSKVHLGDAPEQVERVLGKPFAQTSDETTYNYYSKNAVNKVNKMYSLYEQLDGLTDPSKLEKLKAQAEQLEKELLLLDYKQITVNFVDGKVASLMLDMHVGKVEDKKVDKIYLGTPKGAANKRYTVGLEAVAIGKIDEHIEFTDGSYSLGAASGIEMSDVHKSPASATLSWTNAYGKQSQNVQIDCSDVDFNYDVNNVAYGSLELYGTVLPRSLCEMFGVELPWESRQLSNRTSIYFGANVEFIPDIDEILTDTSSLENIYVESGNKYYSAQAGILFNKDGSEVLYVPSQNARIADTDWYDAQPQGPIYSGSKLVGYKGTMPANYQLTVQEGVTEIMPKALENQTNLASVILPDSVTSIGNNAFSGCSSLQKMTIPAGVKAIGEDAFYDCSSLTTVTFAEGSALESIGYGAFFCCSSLQEITIPASVKTIGGNAFRACDSLATVIFAEGSQLQSFGEYAFYGCTLQAVYYGGSKTQWGNIEKAYNSDLTNAPIYYYSANKPSSNYDSFWRWVEGKPTVWTESDQ